jgi:DNA-directed RNA polymerase specialized sigma subunit
MSLSVHKHVPAKITRSLGDDGGAAKENNAGRKNTEGTIDSNVNNDSLSPKITVLDIERENRLSKVILLYSKGLKQEEIAHELSIDQSTVSRDLHFIKQEARKQVEKYLREDILFEYLRYMAGSNEITRELWEIVQDENSTAKEKTKLYHS